jgi:purine nucleosidase
MADPCRMILDVETGIDDALALHHAVRHPDTRLEAVTTVYGNTDVVIATDNTLKASSFSGAPTSPSPRASDDRS